jgi:uncharacterized repeat protein (TIGR03803 family)
MRTLKFGYHSFSVGVVAAMLAGCGGSQAPIGAPGAMPQAPSAAVRVDSSSYKVLYRFLGPDGALPHASLTDVHGMLYGTTTAGGAGRFGVGRRGVVFSVTTRGSEKALYSFKRAPDGASPYASLIDVHGTLYGTTRDGGSYSYSSFSASGTFFSITTGGSEKVLHSFGYGTDGIHPIAGLIDVDGTLYGTTELGGANRYGGTVFSITTGGAETVLHSFGGAADGANPYASLIEVKGKLYGTTEYGGAYSGCAGGNGCGTVFSLTTSGTEKVLHSFGYGTDGSVPKAGLTDVDGTLYGTTYSGGANNLGTVFSITASGSEKVVYSFAGGADGSYPAAGLIDVDGTLYGTTSAGGDSSCHYDAAGCGTLYSIGPSGAETVLYTFAGGSDGAQPNAALRDVAGVLYGTTTYGGSHNSQCHHSLGCGTVFALTPTAH